MKELMEKAAEKVIEKPEVSEKTKDIKPTLNYDSIYKKGVSEVTPNIKERLEPKLDYSSIYEKESLERLPQNNGVWEGEKGNSKWIPEKDVVPLQQNPEGKTWKEILQEYDTDGILFKDGEPDFSEVADDTVQIKEFTPSRSKNFMQADVEAAKQYGISPKEMAEYRKEKNQTWHERSDCITMDRVPSIIHNNIPHSGGISVIKKNL